MLGFQELAGTGDVADGAVPELQQVPGGRGRPSHLIDRDHRHRGLRAGLHRHQWYGRIGVLQRLGRGLVGRDHEDPVDAVATQAPDGVGDRGAIQALEAGDDDEVAGFVSRALDAQQGRGGPVQGGVEGDDAQRAGASGGQRRATELGE